MYPSTSAEKGNQKSGETTQRRQSPVLTSTAPTPAPTSTSTKKRARDGSSAAPGRLSPMASTTDPHLQSAIMQASQICGKLGYHGLGQLLTQKSSSGGVSSAVAGSGMGFHGGGGASGSGALLALPTLAQVQQAATKAHQEQPPWIHWSKTDMATSLRVTSPHRLELQAQLSSTTTRGAGAAGGYRMARANVGCSGAGSYYFETWILEPPPTTREILQALAPSVRLAPGLRKSLQAALEYEEAQQQKPPPAPAPAATQQRQHSASASTETSADASATAGGGDSGEGGSSAATAAAAGLTAAVNANSSASAGGSSNHQNHQHNSNDPPRRVGGHVRLGWSMRTGELQAPVGYDRWSFAIRDNGGSIITNSQRLDNWTGAEGFGPGDVIGCAICLFDKEDGSHNNNHNNKQGDHHVNHIRFFKNGICMGEFVVAKGKRSGGEAPFQCDIPAGTYYPAVSCYMGGSVRANFGPRFVYPPRKLPAGLKLTPLSELSPHPETSPQVVMAQMAPVFKYLRSTLGSSNKQVEHFQQFLQQSVQAEANILKDMYSQYQRQNLIDIRTERLDRGLTVQDLDAMLGEQDKSN